MKQSIVISAGGSGKRMQAGMPKQFIELKAKPILQWTIEKFRSYNPDIFMVVVLPMDQIKHWKDICEQKGYTIDYEIAVGGKERFHSIKNGIKFCDPKSVIGIHDGVRPFVSIDTIKRSFESAAKTGSGIPCLSINESVRWSDGNSSKHVDRSQFKLVQTPQCFQGEILFEAYRQDYIETYTDDASVVENMGVQVSLVEGNSENIKLTRPEDLRIADLYLA